MTFKKWNLYLGWAVFLIATIVYFITIEDTVSLWDCGEYITAAYKLEVGHPPGAPLFMVLGRMFSFFANEADVAVWINRLSGLSSSLTILFMFWSITLLGQKIVLMRKNALSKGDQIAILASSFIGSLAYTFSDSFWFSAVEGEVYAMASLFTAAIFWAALKWDEEMTMQKASLLTEGVVPNRWLLLIMFMLGLAIGVHLLGILVVPAIGYLIYFQYRKEVTWKGLILTGLISIVTLGFIQEGVIPGSIALASKFEVMFTNSIGLPFFSGTIFFFLMLVFGAIYLIRRARKNGNELLYNITMGLVMLLIGYGSFAVIVIRSNANTPLDENDPENLVTLHAYLKREQYGSAPILFGPYFNSKEKQRAEWGNRSPFYLRRFVVVKGEADIKAFKSEKAANEYAKELGGGSYVDEKYFESNAQDRISMVPTYEQTTFFPRMYYNTGQPSDRAKIQMYKEWSGYDATDGTMTEIGKDGNRLPTFRENMTYFFRYQVNWMYWRYFLWNFAGRQNDIQGHGDQMSGNWLSGFSFIDNARLGNQDNAPYYTVENPSYNRFFFLPLILGLVGLFFHFYRAPKDAFVVTLVFLFTGLAIVVYLNQKPYEPRERDYAYAGSFYFFAIWIGLGVLALYDAFTSWGKTEWKKLGAAAGVGLAFFAILDINSTVSMPNALSWLVIAGIGGAVLFLMSLLKKVLKTEAQGAIVAGLFGLFVPIIMGMQGWDDHDRSLKTTAHDLALNYLNSCEKNGILFTNGDNDTFPLWYMQEVEGQRTDVRVCNLSLMQTDWYTEQMKMKAYDSDPLPIKFREDQTLMYAGNTDQVLFVDLLDLYYSGASQQMREAVLDMRIQANQPQIEASLLTLQGTMNVILPAFTDGQGAKPGRLDLLKRAVAGGTGASLKEKLNNIYTAATQIFSDIQTRRIEVSNQDQIQQFQKALQNFESTWSYTDLQEAMAFVRNDDNMLRQDGGVLLRVFPSKGFVMKVNKANAIASGVITKEEGKDLLDEIRFSFTARGLTREQVMMLDVMANNDWKRGIYYSSPGGSEVAMALYQGRYLKQNGLAYELSPLADTQVPLHMDKMYKNLMEKYKYGAMENPDVLTDYYARRHTSQYRQTFEVLADQYLRKASEAAEIKERGMPIIDAYRQRGQVAEADRFEYILNNADKIISESKDKAKKLLLKSLAEMPAEIVIDNGEPGQGSARYNIEGQPVPSMTDGSLQHYVAMLYEAGAKKEANKLAKELAHQYESIVEYFLTSNPKIAFNTENTKDWFAAMDSYFQMAQAAQDPTTGDPNGAISMHMKKQLEAWYKSDFPTLYNKAEAMITSSGEAARRSANASNFTKSYFSTRDYLDAMARHYGLLQDQNQNAPGMNPVDLNQLMNGQ